MGNNFSASLGIVDRLISFLFVPAISMSTSVAAASAQNIGAGQYSRSFHSLLIGILLSVVPAALLLLFCEFWPQLLTGIFSSDPEVIKISGRYLQSTGIDVVLVCFVFPMNGYFNSMQKSWFSFLHSLLTTFAVRVPLAYVFSTISSSTLYYIGFAAPVSTVCSIILCVVFVLIARKKQNNKMMPAQI
jgi:Na+-driven multidrug efflux pump